jgi:RNA polymerase sigma-70 factor (ECF subfamily)
MTNEAELLLINRIIAGEHTLYAELVNRYKTYAFTIAQKILQNRGEAEEAAQDGFIKAFNNLTKFNGTAKFSTWLYRIVFNTAISYKRKYRPSFQGIEDVNVPHPETTERDIEKADRKQYLIRAMANLNEVDRTALSLFYLDEFSLEEIAEITGQNTNTIKVRIHRARVRIADELKNMLKHEALTL